MALVPNENVNHPLIQRENKGPLKVANKRFDVRVCCSQGFWNTCGDGNAGGSLTPNTVVVFPFSVISTM
jgi:hypothetical protein